MQYLLINKETNIAENAVEWDGNTSTWTPPETHIAVLLEITPSVDWDWDAESGEWVSVASIGCGGIGDTWDGEKLIEPKPEKPPTITDAEPSPVGGGASVIE